MTCSLRMKEAGENQGTTKAYIDRNLLVKNLLRFSMP